jgi:hypothetical protein
MTYIDTLTAKLTAFSTFDELVNTHPNYRPTLLARYGADTIALADAYDFHMAHIGDPRRAYRGHIAPSVRLTRQCHILNCRVDGGQPHDFDLHTGPIPAEQPTTVLSVRLTSQCPHGKRSNQCCGYPEWLRVVHAINAMRDGWIGTPLRSYDWWAGGWAEEYPEFRVILGAENEPGRNYVQAKTDEAAYALKAAVFEVTGLRVGDDGMAV